MTPAKWMPWVLIAGSVFILPELTLAAEVQGKKWEARPAEAKQHFAQWKECQKDEGCTAVVVGCYEWEPVNKAHALEMVRYAYSEMVCLATVGPGARPPVVCEAGLCQKKQKKLSKNQTRRL